MKKNYLFPHYFQWIGLAIAVASIAAMILWPEDHNSLRMPALYEGYFFDDEGRGGAFFTMADTGLFTLAMPLLTIGLIFIGFSKERVEDEYVHYLRAQSLVWSTYVAAGLFILATLLIYGITYLFVPYLVFYVFLLLFIVKFKLALYRVNKGGER